MSVVGRAYITVRAVTRQVEGDVQKGVDKALDNVEKKMDKAGEDSGKKFGEGMGDGVEKSGVDKKIDKSVKKYDSKKSGKDAGTLLGQAIGEGLLERGPVERAFRRVGRSLSISADKEGDSIGRKMARGIGKGLLKVGTNPIALIGTIALPAIADALQIVSSAAASATALVGTLGPAFAAVGIVGASSMMAIVSAVGAVTMAFKLKTAALDEFKTGLRPLRDEWIGIGKAVQRQVLPALDHAANSLMANLGPTLRGGLVETGKAVGDIAARFEKLGENMQFQRRLGTVMKSNAAALRDFGAAGALTASSFMTMAAAASPLTQRFSQWTRELALNVTQQLAAAEMSGRLGEWFDRAGNIAAQWGRILGDVGSALMNVFSAGMGEGGHLLNMLENITSKFEAWSGSMKGQNALKDWFEGATPVMQAVGDVLVGLTKGMGEWMSGTGTAEDSLQSLADMLPDLGKALGVLSEGFRTLAGAILPPLGQLADKLAPVVADVADELGNNLSKALDDVVPALGDLLVSALEIVDAFAPALPVLGQIAGVIANSLAPVLNVLADVLDGVPSSVMGAVGAFIILRTALRSLNSEGKLTNLGRNVGNSLKNMRDEMSQTSGAAGKFKGLMGALGGGWGAALSGATIALGIYMAKQAEVEGRIDSVRQSLDDQTGAWTANTREIIANALVGDEWDNVADKYGISMGEIVDAVQQGGSAIDELEAKMRAQAGSNNNPFNADAWTNDVNQFSDKLRDLHGESVQAADDQKKIADGVRTHGDALAGVAPSVDRLAKVEAQLGGAARKTSGDLKGQKTATDALKASTLSYHEAVLKTIQGHIGFERAIDDARKEIEKGKKTLDLNSEAGRKNMEALLGVASAANEVKGSAEKQQAALDRARDFIAKWADEAGYGTDKAGRFADRLITLKDKADAVPESINTKINLDDGTARIKLMNFSAALEGLDGKTAQTHITITTDHINNRLGDVNVAGGGWIHGPGTTTSDSILYGNANVSNKEFVVNAKDAKRNARLLEALNKGKDVSQTVVASGRSAPVNITINNPMQERVTTSVTGALKQRAVNAGWTS